MEIDSRAGTQEKSTDAHTVSQIKIDRTGENYYIREKGGGKRGRKNGQIQHPEWTDAKKAYKTISTRSLKLRIDDRISKFARIKLS